MHKDIFNEAILIKEESREMLRNIDGTQQKYHLLIDCACEFEKAANEMLVAYKNYSTAVAQYKQIIESLHPKLEKKEQTKTDKVLKRLETIDLIGKCIKLMKG